MNLTTKWRVWFKALTVFRCASFFTVLTILVVASISTLLALNFYARSSAKFFALIWSSTGFGLLMVSPSIALWVFMWVARVVGSDRAANFWGRLCIGISICAMLLFVPGLVHAIRTGDGSGLAIVAFQFPFMAGALCLVAVIVGLVAVAVRALKRSINIEQ